MDNHFGHWLAGFIAGEGCFRIHKEKQGGYYACHFTLKLRDDERPILEQIVTKVGIGHLKPDSCRGNSKPCLIWVVQSRTECLALISVLDHFPLRGRKAQDYAIWRKATRYWARMKRGNRWHGPRDWSQMIAYKIAIEQARAYHVPTRPSPLLPVFPSSAQ